MNPAEISVARVDIRRNDAAEALSSIHKTKNDTLARYFVQRGG